MVKFSLSYSILSGVTVGKGLYTVKPSNNGQARDPDFGPL